MNYFAHALLASRFRDDPGFVLGAMLPDWLRWIGARPDAAPDTALAAGMQFHHRSDGAFHAAPTFVALTREAAEQLLDVGVGRGPARGVAHVGVELLLDGALYRRSHPAAVRRYAAALSAASSASRSVGWSRPEGGVRMRRVARHLGADDPVARYDDPDRVAQAVERTLRARPRLRIAPDEMPRVSRWARSWQPRIERLAEILVDETEAGLGASLRGADAGSQSQPGADA